MTNTDTVSKFCVYNAEGRLLVTYNTQGGATAWATRHVRFRDLEVVEEVYGHIGSFLKRRVDLGKVVF